MVPFEIPGCRVLTVEESEKCLVVLVAGTATKQVCPDCGHESDDEHSTYVRTLRDLPVQGRPVRIKALARRWRCLNRGCQRKTFCEPFTGLAKRHAQRTERMTGTMEHFVLTLSSNMAAYLLRLTGLETSGRTLLRVVDHGEKPVPAPRVLGVDDFALRRGRTYGTILIDLEKSKPIGILLGRNREPLQGWLTDHPGIEIAARDRASAYADALSAGAPQAIQVADRFHLVKNVSETLKEVVDRQSWALPEPAPLPVAVLEADTAPEPAPVPEPPPPKRMSRAERRKAASAERLLRRYEEVHKLRGTGMSIRQIRMETGLSRQAIRKYLSSSVVPKRAELRRRPSQLDPFIAYLKERWQAGCHNARALHAELAKQGFKSSLTAVSCFVRPWRAECPPPLRKEPPHSQPKCQPRPQKPNWKDVRALVLRTPEKLRDAERRALYAFLELHPKLKLAHNLVQQFRDVLKGRDPTAFDTWRTAASTSELEPFERLANNLNADRMAILAAIEQPWSTGPVEGHITRVKLLKRVGYGRASLPLLRARILYEGLQGNRSKTRKRSEKGASQHATA